MPLLFVSSHMVTIFPEATETTKLKAPVLAVEVVVEEAAPPTEYRMVVTVP